MSFILDALKKSELERQRQSVPGLMDAGPLPKRARFPAWALALAALLAVNLAVLVVVLARGGLFGASAHRTAERHAVPGVSASAPATTIAPPPVESARTEPHFSPMDAAPPVYAPEIPPADTSSSPPKAVAPAPPPHAASAAAPRDRDRDPLLTDEDKSAAEVLPTMSELNLSGANALPDLHLDVHVYATRAADRFVYINMHKYQQGETLAEGPVIERIRRDGVVLEYHGLRFLLPRQQ
jgi:general secretion pathway protein B